MFVEGAAAVQSLPLMEQERRWLGQIMASAAHLANEEGWGTALGFGALRSPVGEGLSSHPALQENS